MRDSPGHLGTWASVHLSVHSKYYTVHHQFSTVLVLVRLIAIGSAKQNRVGREQNGKLCVRFHKATVYFVVHSTIYSTVGLFPIGSPMVEQNPSPLLMGFLT